MSKSESYEYVASGIEWNGASVGHYATIQLFGV